MAKRSLANEKKRALAVLERLYQTYPDVACTLDFTDDPFRLLVGAILAAQCTDARVNSVTPELFRRFPEVRDFAAGTAEEIEPLIKSCGLFRMKARNIQRAAVYLNENHDGKVPSTEAELLKVPGVGRKIANLLLGDSFGQQAVVVDTHCSRISRLLGFTKNENPAVVERDLMKVLPESSWTDWGHLLVTLGRDICVARRPQCGRCPLQDVCDHGQKQAAVEAPQD